jgi:hypothetical protein
MLGRKPSDQAPIVSKADLFFPPHPTMPLAAKANPLPLPNLGKIARTARPAASRDMHRGGQGISGGRPILQANRFALLP